MGNNSAYTIVEQIIVGAYEQGKLDKELLSTILDAGSYTDIDTGGSRNLRAKRDDLDAEEIVVKIMTPEVVLPKRPKPRDDGKYDTAYEDYVNARSSAFFAIVKKYGW